MLSKEQVHHITRRIRRRSFKSFSLEEELIDFISCEVEARVSNGEDFEKVLSDVIEKVELESSSKSYKIDPLSKPKNIDMLQNYFKIAVRNFAKHRTNSFINIAGLMLSLVSVLIIGLYVSNEYSIDKNYPDSDRLYRVNGTSYMGDTPSSSNFVSPLLIDAMLEEIPEIEYAASILSYNIPGAKRVNEQTYYDIRIDYLKEDFFEIFGVNIVEGNLETAYEIPNGVLVSESFAQRIFGHASPIGMQIETGINESRSSTFTIQAVFSDLPIDSHLKEWSPLEVIGSPKTRKTLSGSDGAWNSTHGPAYVKISKDKNVKEVNDKLSALLKRRAGEDIFYEHYLQPVWDIHLNTLGLRTTSSGDKSQVLIFGMIGLLILTIACINYVNLTTARITVRSKEVGVRMVLGAGRGQFLFQFIVEAFILTIAALLIALVLVSLSLDTINSTFDLTLPTSVFEHGSLLLGVFVALFLVSVTSGGYSGLYLSSMQSTRLLRSTLTIKNKRFSMRKVLVVVQFAVSASIIICTIFIVNQLRFLRNSDLGYDKESIVYVRLPYNEIKTKGILFRDLLNNMPEVSSASFTGGSLAMGNLSGNGISFGNSEEHSMQRILPVDFNYLETMGIEVQEGRWFNKDIFTDIEEGFVVNEAFLRYFEINDPLGKKISRNEQKGQIIGVTKDFHWQSKHSEIGPLVMFMRENYASRYNRLVIKLNPGDLKNTRQKLAEGWASIFGDRPFEWIFLDEQLERAYQKDRVFGDIFASFSVMAIVVSCLGLLGLVSFSMERRLKEIGVRKVLGASISNILILVSKDFSLLVLLGFLLSTPVAYYIVDQWLLNFQYRIDLSYEPFIFACILTIAIAWTSVSFIAFRAARANPVDSLRSE